MKTALRFLMLTLAFVAFPALSQSFTLDTPKGWVLEWSPDSKHALAAPDANFRSDSDRISASISIMKKKDVPVLSDQQLREVILTMAEDSLPNSIEGQANIVPFGASRGGLYVRLTDKERKTAYKYITFAIHRKGPELALGYINSNDDDGAVLQKYLAALESVVYTSDKASSANLKTSRPAAQAREDEVWGAIATETTKGENNPYYGIGGGDTEAEAERNAIKFCREDGAKRCAVRLTYTQCGAYAVSESGAGSGAGTGATKRAAEKQALSVCKGRNCEIVASDCN